MVLAVVGAVGVQLDELGGALDLEADALLADDEKPDVDADDEEQRDVEGQHGREERVRRALEKRIVSNFA